MDLVQVEIDSVRVSLMSQQRIVILRDKKTERFLTIWIGPCEADAITVELQSVEVARPLTHDLLKSVIGQMGGKIKHIIVNDLRNDIFYARIIVALNGNEMEIDSRPSDAIALAVRAKVPIFVAESVMQKAAITPDEEIDAEAGELPESDVAFEDEAEEDEAEEGEDLDVFKDFLDTLDMDDLGDEE
jgi:bifunctional DNase/RNase